MESMGYVTAGLLDSVVHPDAAVESAIVKVCDMPVYIAAISSSNTKDTFEKSYFSFFIVQAAWPSKTN